MGKHSRDKGRSFEQLVATAYRRQWKEATVRRALQAHRAFEPDVVVEGHALGARFWTECQHADSPEPLVKLAQAERDINRLNTNVVRLPLVVWRRSGSRTVQLTTRLWVLDSIAGRSHHMADWQGLVVTLDFHAWLAALGA
jgi:hypothetical protein